MYWPYCWSHRRSYQRLPVRDNKKAPTTSTWPLSRPRILPVIGKHQFQALHTNELQVYIYNVYLFFVLCIGSDIRNAQKVEHVIQVQLRFCMLETSCEQEDYFPPNVVVKVNNKMCPLPVSIILECFLCVFSIIDITSHCFAIDRIPYRRTSQASNQNGRHGLST